ncbi:MAG TPA: 16S rRNA (adenine(1518)-N(6)/adenine(1519)-N(6))-dimethyltransferase RsmA [Candidatus Dormibacteraeota bacterium]|jgi:16S rRNA (adenine1518-N6/adenine1519-N6)-dimethyltransferase|nr:16S rRNA (adenine(1518)-N(6)/adenine(1519)-N(6))-dimethyltransferase RsmA [Candidatus Dormibacteraeota bacterium]
MRDRSPRPIKRLGQHFLVDEELRDRVLAAAGITGDDEVLEVGSGPGTLTAGLVRIARRVVAVELDGRQLPELREAAPGAEVVSADILKLDVAALFPEGGQIVVGNIPYYLTGALIEKLLQEPPRPRRLSLVVQREVAQRWCGLSGWSLATVAVQTLAKPRIEFELPPEAFEPPPEVHSALAVLEVRERPAVTVPDLGRFFRFVEVVFQFRRKQLGGSLVRITGGDRGRVLTRFEDLGIDPQRRAETLSLAEWEAMFGAFGEDQAAARG